MERSAEKNTVHTVFCPSGTMHWFASTPPIRTAIQLAHNQSENPVAQTSDGPPPQTLHVKSEQTTSKSFQRSWTHRTYLFPTSSESPQTLQTSNGWAGVFLPLQVELMDILKDTLVQFPTDRYFWWEGKPSAGVFVATTAGILSHVLLTKWLLCLNLTRA